MNFTGNINFANLLALFFQVMVRMMRRRKMRVRNHWMRRKRKTRWRKRMTKSTVHLKIVEEEGEEKSNRCKQISSLMFPFLEKDKCYLKGNKTRGSKHGISWR